MLIDHLSARHASVNTRAKQNTISLQLAPLPCVDHRSYFSSDFVTRELN